MVSVSERQQQAAGERAALEQAVETGRVQLAQAQQDHMRLVGEARSAQALGESVHQALLQLHAEAGSAIAPDADALMLLTPAMLVRAVPMLATPHDGELEALCRSFGVIAETRRERAMALAKVSGMVVLAKGPDSIVAAPDRRLALGQLFLFRLPS